MANSNFRLNFQAASYSFAIPRRDFARGMHVGLAQRGRGECRVPAHPQPRV